MEGLFVVKEIMQKRGLHVQIGHEGCLLLGSSRQAVSKICSFSMEMELTLYILLFCVNKNLSGPDLFVFLCQNNVIQ